MKRFLAPILLLTLLFPSLAFGKTIKWEGLIITNGLYFKKFTNVPFTGTVTGKEQGKLKDGKKAGLWIEYNSDGRLWKEATYQNGMKTEWTKYEYHNNGQVRDKFTYKDGKKDGPQVTYWENGQLDKKGVHKDDKRMGPWVEYYRNGQLYEKGTYKNGKKEGPFVSHVGNGVLTTQTYRDGLLLPTPKPKLVPTPKPKLVPTPFYLYSQQKMERI